MHQSTPIAPQGFVAQPPLRYTRTLNMKRDARIYQGAKHALITILCAATLAVHASEPMMNRFWVPCDVEWDRIKSLPPLSKAEYAQWLARKPSSGIYGGVKEGEADYYYFMARIPFVIGLENTPSMEQRDAWLQKAADLGLKAAKAALMRLRYLGPEDAERLRNGGYPKPLVNPRATRTEYLLAAREAAEAGDPEFATVMMDTAQNTNRRMHCQDADTTKVDTTVATDGNRMRCDPQEVTKVIESKKWAEIAARGGNPNAKGLLCVKTYFGTFPEQGFTGGPAEAFPWCFATTQTACMAGSNAGLLEGMYDLGKGTAKNPEKAAELRKRYPMPPSFPKTIIFPLITR
jgi:hypothetical protein